MFKEKLAAFIGSKAMYITLSSVLAVGLAITGTVIGVNNHRHKQDFIPVENTQTIEDTTELSAESTTEDTTADTTVATTAAPKKASEPSGDKALQYIKEYDKLTAEYETKKAELENQTSEYAQCPPFIKIAKMAGDKESEEERLKRISEVESINASRKAVWEAESASNAEEQAKSDNAKKQLAELKNQYNKDVTALKAKYGI